MARVLLVPPCEWNFGTLSLYLIEIRAAVFFFTQRFTANKKLIIIFMQNHFMEKNDFNLLKQNLLKQLYKSICSILLSF